MSLLYQLESHIVHSIVIEMSAVMSDITTEQNDIKYACTDMANGQTKRIADYSPNQTHSSKTNQRTDLNCESECTTVNARHTIY